MVDGASCRHGKRPVSASVLRLKRLRDEWDFEREQSRQLARESLALAARREGLYALLNDEGPKKVPKAAARPAGDAAFGAEMRFFASAPQQPHRQPRGRSSRRTAFVTDYKGNLHTGPERRADADRLNGSQNPSIEPVPAASAGASAAVGSCCGAQRSSPEVPGHRPSLTFNITRTTEAPYRMRPAGIRSVRDVEDYGKLATCRKRWYTDYSGDRILVDLHDLPRISAYS
ncbi:hypothetical protein DIPPA_21115 [Diplonema papillatum]|nr:hypothetical protein DIPPA_21115 [Diplonema papillatum]